jgi:hypothetical protein
MWMPARGAALDQPLPRSIIPSAFGRFSNTRLVASGVKALFDQSLPLLSFPDGLVLARLGREPAPFSEGLVLMSAPSAAGWHRRSS